MHGLAGPARGLFLWSILGIYGRMSSYKKDVVEFPLQMWRLNVKRHDSLGVHLGIEALTGHERVWLRHEKSLAFEFILGGFFAVRMNVVIKQ